MSLPKFSRLEYWKVLLAVGTHPGAPFGGNLTVRGAHFGQLPVEMMSHDEALERLDFLDDFLESIDETIGFPQPTI